MRRRSWIAALKPKRPLGQPLGLPKVDVELAGVAKPDLFPRDVCLLRKEDVSLFYFGHNTRVSWAFPMMDAFAVDHLSDLEDARGRALEADDCVPRLHIPLKLIEPEATLHGLKPTTPEAACTCPGALGSRWHSLAPTAPRPDAAVEPDQRRVPGLAAPHEAPEAVQVGEPVVTRPRADGGPAVLTNEVNSPGIRSEA